MKNLHVIGILLFSIFMASCSSDDTADAPAKGPTAQATINGATFSDYVFKLGVYNISKSSNGNLLTIDIADSNGKMVTIFLNNTGGFSSGTVKKVGNVDSDNFKTYVMIKDNQPPTSYFSESGMIKITKNQENPENSKQNLISGEYNIVASTIDGKSKTTMKGAFNALVYAK